MPKVLKAEEVAYRREVGQAMKECDKARQRLYEVVRRGIEQNITDEIVKAWVMQGVTREKALELVNTAYNEIDRTRNIGRNGYDF